MFMLLRVLGVIAIMTGAVGLGFYYSARDGFRISELREAKKAFTILAAEIEYMSSPLSTACQHIAQRTSHTIGQLFSHFSQLIENNTQGTCDLMWAQSLDYVREKSFMSVEDFSVLEGFGKTLGYLDKAMQKNAISYTVDYINQKVTHLESHVPKNKKMYRSLGIIGGLALATILW